MNEAKQVSFRLNQENAEKFRQQAEENGLSQAEMFERLLKTYEASQATAQLPDRAGEIKAFTQLTNELYTLFLGSLTISRGEKEKQIEVLTKELEAKEAQNKKLSDSLEEIMEKLCVQEQITEEKSKECSLLSAHLATSEAEKEEKEETIQNQNRQITRLNDLLDESKDLKKLSERLEQENMDLKQEKAELDLQLKNGKEMQEFYKNQCETFSANLKEAEERHKAELDRRDSENKEKIQMITEQFQERIKLLQAQLNKE